MTKKDYELIAKALVSKKPNENWLNKYLQYEMIVFALGNALADENPRFDRIKFLKACGLKD